MYLKFCWHTATLIYWSMVSGCFYTTGELGSFVSQTLWPTESQILTNWPFIETADFCPRWMLIILIFQDIFLLITYQNVKVLTCLSYHIEFLNNKPVNIILFAFLNNLLAMAWFLILFGPLPNPMIPPRTVGKSFK